LWAAKYDNLRGLIVNEITAKAMIETKLGKMIENEIYELHKNGVGLKEAIKRGTLIAEKAWREKNADKSGG